MQFFQFFHLFLFFFAYNLWQQVRYARKSPWAVPFGSNTFLKSEWGYQCLIRQVIDHYDQFQNGRSKIHVFFPKYIIEHGFNKFRITSTVRVSSLTFYCSFKYLQMLECDIKDSNRDDCQKWSKIFSKFHIFLQIFDAHVLSCKKTPTIGVIWFRDNPWVKII